MKSKFSILLVLILSVLTSCSSSPKEPKLDIASFLNLTKEDAIYPNAEQIAMIEGLIPEENYAPFPSIENREYWDKIAQSEEGAKYLSESLAMLSDKPQIPISDEIYRRANKEGNRGIYKPRYYFTMDRLEHFLIAECIQNKGTFLPQIETFTRAILSMKSWVHPNHDDKDNGVLEGRRVTIDLSARKFGFVLALTETTLNNKLSENLRKDILEQLNHRVINSYLTSCKEEDPADNKWIRSKNNWNPVCSSGTLLTIMTTSKDKSERVAAIGSAINSMKYFISGFGDDGYCSEGLGYWNYGFGHYLYLAEIIYDYTDGKIDLFEFNDPQKMQNISNFPARYEIHDKWYAPFSDGVTQTQDSTDNFAYLMAAKHYNAAKPTYFIPDESVFTIIGWNDAPKYTDASTKNILPLVTYFDKCGIVISRGTQEKKFSAAIKAGHNDENHNHNDVGSYFVLLDNEIVSGDIGAPSYIEGAFSPDNPARSSWGHPVPRINNKLQSKGEQFRGTILDTQFEEAKDIAKLNIKDAYEIPELTKLERTMTNTRAGKGEISVTDEFTAEKPITFGTAVMVNVDYKIEENSIILYTGKNKVKVSVEAKGGEIKLTDEWVPVEKLRSGRKSYRIGIDFIKPLTEGSISVTYTPLD